MMDDTTMNGNSFSNEEKKWSWYKNTKPCYAILNKQECPKKKSCNYAHSLTEYMNAITKRKFKIDDDVIRSFQRLTEQCEPSNKKRRLEE